MIPTKKYLETIKFLKFERVDVFFDYHKKTRVLNVHVAHLNTINTIIKFKCSSDKQYDNYVKEFESAREKGDLAKFLKRVRSKIISIE